MAQISEDVLDAMAEAYQQAVSDIQIAAEFAAIDAWYAFDSFAGTDEAEWIEAFWPIVIGSASAISQAARTYMEIQLAYTGVALPLPDIDLDWVAEDYAAWATSPMVKARWTIAESSGEAFSEGAARASKLVTSMTREAEQEAFRQMIESYQFDVQWTFVDDDRPDVPYFPGDERSMDDYVQAQKREGRKMVKGGVHFRRVPQADACGFCRVVADRLYPAKTKEKHPTGAWHLWCRCSWKKVTTSEKRAFDPQYDQGQWRDVIKERYDEQGINP